MSIISAVLPLIIIVVVFFFIVRVATVILKLTGMDETTARFQSISAFTGTGFTTKEAETILEDKIRIKTIVALMVLGKVGIVSVIASLFVSFGKSNLEADLWKALIVLGSIFLLHRITTLKGFSFALNKLIEKSLTSTVISKKRTIEELLNLPKGYGLTQLIISENSKENGLSLADAGFSRKDILVLSIERKDTLISFPHADDKIKSGDRLLCYGLLENIKTYA
ncbi:MAG: TrkA C-terminal domain-containing protein [Candidatus Omnitrophica bacterium]|nr:TrkA C-terminal domain-containing protein [Candidatus Omnitrophota bacterium]